MCFWLSPSSSFAPLSVLFPLYLYLCFCTEVLGEVQIGLCEVNRLKTQHRELRVLLFTISVMGFFYVPQRCWALKCCETGPMVYSPFSRRLDHESVGPA